MDPIMVALLVLVAGIGGGTVNYALSRTDTSTRQDWCWAVVIGTGAAFLVPLFLNTISSTLLPSVLARSYKTSDLFVFLGFCLLGAIASRSMIQTLTDKVLKEATAARKEVTELENAMAPLIDRVTEQDDDTAPPVEQKNPLDDGQKAVLKALNHDRFSLRSISGISGDVPLDRQSVVTNLRLLSNLGLASEVQGKKGKRWAITPLGRRQDEGK